MNQATNQGPTVPPPVPATLASVLNRNIHALQDRRRADERKASTQEKIAEAITHFTGSMAFVYIHLALFGLWILLNVGLVPGFKPWDPTFVILATAASVEAIFLSTFVLISQNRAAALDDKRADLDLQINLLSEHEVTRLLTLTKAIAKHLGVDTSDQPELEELERDVAPEAVLDKIEDRAMRSDQ
ncbi:DUF1003 domain-containing protein [Lichenihabitans sp. PAMC28606]|uniref:DUF1003 domain-containing protein n=1 Tax=Lichenihabitans sp. PAMC28606 TaxID=2880932 RepID=UPI001D0A3268|nr:DUF1003 domain-containing protein [Lichenihabitans sp. PAMC28606]UDL93126.1 DUF1003 domain-containing protein [Lichenihabitans sp. PAMC28606]